MARVFIDGFGSKSTQNWIIENGVSYESGYARLEGPSASMKKYCDESSYYIGFKAYWVANLDYDDSGRTGRLLFYNSSGDVLAYFKAWQNNISLRLANNNIVVAYTSPSAIYHIWNHFQIYYNPSTSAGNFILKLNGLEVVNFSGGPTASSEGLISSFKFLGIYGDGGFYIDDFILDNSEFPGISSIQTLFPNGNGTSEWKPSSIGKNNYTMIDESPPSDIDFIFTTENNKVDLYTIEDFVTTPNLEYQIKAIQINTRTSFTGSGSPQISIALKNPAVSAVYSTPKIVSSLYTGISEIYNVNPNTENPWTVNELNDLEIGIVSVI